ncbi:MAG: twin-arginine translocation signal domain-containing protein, partial [Mesorhizobium sp.]
MTYASSSRSSIRGVSRRQFLATSMAGGAALALGGGKAFAQTADTLKVGFVSPRTGPLAGFGQTDGYVLDLARKALASGLDIGGKKYSVEILDQDTQSDPSRAGQLAKDLINNQA